MLRRFWVALVACPPVSSIRAAGTLVGKPLDVRRTDKNRQPAGARHRNRERAGGRHDFTPLVAERAALTGGYEPGDVGELRHGLAGLRVDHGDRDGLEAGGVP
jgi:hypothetical protein